MAQSVHRALLCMFKPCLVVPVYRHAGEFKAFAKRLPEGIPVIVVDDGNTDEEVRLLESIGHPLLRLPRNQGKTAAVLAGMKKAMDEGYTHALQIDADGQHNPDDIERFLQKAQDYPQALINSCPIYDESAPKLRVFGRRITNFWVRLETGDKSIKDAMCGFRVYPLAAMKPILKAGIVFHRMGGDIEMLVRASWHNILVLNLGTKVIYPKGAVSNFSMLKDNLGISALHTMLVFTKIKKLFFGGKNDQRGN